MNPKKIILVGSVAALTLAGAAGLALLFVQPSLSLTFELDGKPLPSGGTPVVTIDGRPFTSGGKLRIGQHTISVTLPNVEPYETTFLLGLESKSLGPLPLVSVTGAINVSTYPSDCQVTLKQGTVVVQESIAPAHFTNLSFGDYELEVRKSGSKETGHIVVDEEKPKNVTLTLRLGEVALSSVPADSDFSLSGGGHNWDGRLPSNIQDVPVGTYELCVRRKGWEKHNTLEVQLGKTSSNQTVFSYGTINVSSDPIGMEISSNGISIGKAPITLNELKPETYVISASDGENQLSTSITVEPNQNTNQLFTFRYGAIQFNSAPPGASIMRRGKEAGKTPLTIDHVPAGGTTYTLELAGYCATNCTIQVTEGNVVPITVILLNERYVGIMREAHAALDSAQFDKAKMLAATAVELDTNDVAASNLLIEINQAAANAEEVRRKEQANAKAQELASLAGLDFQQIISDCTDTKQVQHPVQKVRVTYETYRDNDGKYKTREVKSAPFTVMETKTESTFNDGRFAAKYIGKTYKFNSTGWRLTKTEKDGSIVFRTSGSRNSLQFGQDEIRVIPLAGHQDEFSSIQDGQRIIIKAKIKSHDRGDFFSRVLQRINLEDAERLDK